MGIRPISQENLSTAGSDPANSETQTTERLDAEVGFKTSDVIEPASNNAHLQLEFETDFTDSRNADLVQSIKQGLNDAMDSLNDDSQELQFRIQTATSDMQNAETLASSVMKDLDDARKGIMGNLTGGGSEQTPTASAIKENFRLGDLVAPQLDAMHGQPQNYEDLQKVVQDLKQLIDALQISNIQKAQFQAMLQQLDQMSHQMPIDPQAPDQNFSDALKLLNDLRTALAPFVS